MDRPSPGDENLRPARGTAPDNYQAFVPDFSQPTYLECVVPADGGTPVLVPVSAKAGAFEIRRIRLLAKNRR